MIKTLSATAVACCALFSTLVSTPAAADTTFPVMNTSEQPPDGVYFRKEPRMDSAVRISGFGVFKNEVVSAACFTRGEKVGKFGNDIWYYAKNVTRPSVGGQSNEGYINTHFIDDGMKAGQAAPGVPQCGQLTQKPVASVYFSPYDGPDSEKRFTGTLSTVANVTYYTAGWKGKSCSLASTPSAAGRRIATIAGFSVGRSGVTTYLRTAPNHASDVDYAILFDPGSYKELKGSCKRADIGPAILAWLNANPNARMVVFAGKATRDAGNTTTVNGTVYMHRGIQEFYFNAVRGTSAAARITVCNYDNMGHEAVWTQFESWIGKPPITDSCPVAPNGTRPDALWHP